MAAVSQRRPERHLTQEGLVVGPLHVGVVHAQVHDGPVGQRSAMQLHAGGTGVQHLGWIVPNHALRRTAYEVAARTAGVQIVSSAKVTRVAVSATKSSLGHPLGAAGALEAVVTVLALHRGDLPPTLGDPDALDEDCAGVTHVAGAARRGARPRAALSNSFAFGGSNAVLAFRAPG